MFREIARYRTNITLPYSGTKKDKLEFIERTARKFCEQLDSYLDTKEQKNYIKKKELLTLFSELFPGLKIKFNRMSLKDNETEAAVVREENCYIMRLKPRKNTNVLANLVDYLKPLIIDTSANTIESIKHEACHIISQSIRGNAFKNKDIREFMIANIDFLEDMRYLLEQKTNLHIYPIPYFKNNYKKELQELFIKYKANEYEQIHVLSTLKRLIEEEKLAYNISLHNSNTTMDEINEIAYKVEKKYAFNKKLEVINLALKQRLTDIRNNKKDTK